MAADVVINEWAQGGDDWVELVVLTDGADLGGYWLTDSGDVDATQGSEYGLQFASGGYWSSVPAGTVIVIVDGNGLPGSLSVDTDMTDGNFRLVFGASEFANTTYFTVPELKGLSKGTMEDNPRVLNAAQTVVHDWDQDDEADFIAAAKRPDDDNETVYFTGDSEGELSDATQWTLDESAAAATPGDPNGGDNTTWIEGLRPAPEPAISIDATYFDAYFDNVWPLPASTPEITSITVSGSTLTTDDVVVTIADGTHFDLSTGTLTWSDSLTLSPSGGTLDQVINVRYNPQSAGTHATSISATGGGDTTDPTPVDMMGSANAVVSLVITQIMYDGEGEDWLEIYNPGSSDIDLAGFVVDDGNGSALGSANIAAGTIKAGDVAYLTTDSPAAFQAIWGSNLNVIQCDPAYDGFGGGGDVVGIWQSYNMYAGDHDADDGHHKAIDSVDYDSDNGFPDPSGQSIYLIDVSLDNSAGANWAAADTLGATRTGLGGEVVESTDFGGGVKDQAIIKEQDGLAVIINEWAQKGAGGAGGDWVELLVLREGADLSGYWAIDSSPIDPGNDGLQFASNGYWSSVPAGTIILLVDDNDLPTSLSVDTDMNDGNFRLVFGSDEFENTAYFAQKDFKGLGGDMDDNPRVFITSTTLAHDWDQNDDLNFIDAALRPDDNDEVVYYTGNTAEGVADYTNWTLDESGAAATPGEPNGGDNSTWVDDLRPDPGIVVNTSAMKTSFDNVWPLPAGAAEVTTFSLSGDYLSAPVTVTLGDGTHFDLSKDRSTWADSLTFNNSGTIAGEIVFVSYDPQSAGSHADAIGISGGGDPSPPSDIAVYGSALAPVSGLKIVQIMASPNGDKDFWEWVEVYNSGSTAIDLAGFVIDDGNSSMLASANIASGVVPAGGVAYLCTTDTLAFRNAWGPGVNAILTSPRFDNLGGDDTVGIWQSYSQYVGDHENHTRTLDSVTYDEVAPWPIEPEGQSIYLTDVSLDNSAGANWAAADTLAATRTGLGGEVVESGDLGEGETDRGLILGADVPDAIVHEWGQNDEDWVEILVVTDGLDMRGWFLTDSKDPSVGGDGLQLANTAPFDSVPAGTLIVIYEDGNKPAGLPADDETMADGNYTLIFSDASSLVAGGGFEGLKGDAGSDDNPRLFATSTTLVHDWAQEADPAFLAIRAASDQTVQFNGSSAMDALYAENWLNIGLDTPTFGQPNGGDNTLWVYGLRDAVLTADTAGLDTDFGAVWPVPVTTPQVKTFTVEGRYLKSNVTVSVDNMLNYDVSADGSTWGDTATLVPTSMTLSAATVYVRYDPQLAGTHNTLVSFSGGGVASLPADIAFTGSATTPDAPMVVDHPDSILATIGDTVVFYAEVSGDGPFTFTWQHNSSTVAEDATHTIVSGDYGTTLTIANAQASDAGFYRILANNAGGGARSNDASLTFDTGALAINGHPRDVTAVFGGSATFNVAASGSQPIAYQWYHGTTLLPNASTASLTISPLGWDDDGTYYCHVSNGDNPTGLDSDPATLRFLPAGVQGWWELMR